MILWALVEPALAADMRATHTDVSRMLHRQLIQYENEHMSARTTFHTAVTRHDDYLSRTLQ